MDNVHTFNTWLAVVKGVLMTAGGVVTYVLGGLDQLLVILLVLLAMDYGAGILKAIHQKKLSSEIGAKGIVRKVGKLLVVGLAFWIEILTGNTFALRELVIMFFISNEGISILENLAEIGVPFPKKMKEVLIQIKGETEEDKETQEVEPIE